MNHTTINTSSSPSGITKTAGPRKNTGSWHAHLLYFDRRQCVLFCHDLEPYIYDVPNVLDLDPIAASARVTQRPATIAGEWIQPDVELLKLVHAL